MNRAKFDKAAGDAIGAAVREVEARTNAEIVVAVRGRSGTYRHADYLFGAVIAFIGHLFVLLSPFEFNTFSIPLDVIALFLAGACVSLLGDCIRVFVSIQTSSSKASRACCRSVV